MFSKATYVTQFTPQKGFINILIHWSTTLQYFRYPPNPPCFFFKGPLLVGVETGTKAINMRFRLSKSALIFFFSPWCPCPWLLLNRSLSRCATSFKLASLANNYAERSSCSKSNAQLTFEFLTRNLPVDSYFGKPKHLIHSRDVTSTQELVPARNDKTVVSSRNVACFLELTWANDYEPFFLQSTLGSFRSPIFFFAPLDLGACDQFFLGG